MKKSIFILLAALFVLVPIRVTTACDHHRDFDYHYGGFYDDVDIDIDDGSVIITCDDRHGGEIEITEDYELIIDGELIKTDAEQKELLREYHYLVIEIHDHATDIGLEGARIGIKGAGLGLKAIGCVFKLLRSDYDEDDLEREMEREAAKLEADAEKLEIKAEKIEDMADDLEILHEDLSDQIPELAELDWWD